LEAVNDATFRLKLKEPYGLVLRSLAKPYSYIPFILPERHASQSADKPFEGDPWALALHLLESRVGAGQQDDLPQVQGLRAPL